MSQKSDIKNRVLHEIQSKQIAPISKEWWRFRELAVWCLWFVSVMIGGVALSVVWYASLHGWYGLYEAADMSPFLLVLSYIPKVWLVVFGLMLGLSYYHVRNLKRGYTYPFWQIIGSSFIFSVIGGIVLHLGGFNMLIDRSVGAYMPMYMTQEKMELAHWQQPAAGKLVGVFGTSTGKIAYFTDVADQVWEVDTRYLEPRDRELMTHKKQVRLFGSVARTNRFVACAVFPWRIGERQALVEMSAGRQAMVERIYRHADTPVVTQSATSALRNNPCQTSGTLERIRARMR